LIGEAVFSFVVGFTFFGSFATFACVSTKKSSIFRYESSIGVSKTGGRSFTLLDADRQSELAWGAVTAERGVEIDESLPVLGEGRS
jgi:hypothetical protein